METNEQHNNAANSILIVDDNPQNLQVLGRLLQEKGYGIEFAINGPAALDWLSSGKFDLVLLDINMPEMDGYEVCRRIRADSRLQKLPVVFLSADNDRESILMGFEAGGQDYVTKPFDSRELIIRVKTHITLKNSLEKLETLNRSLEGKVQERTLQLSEAMEKLEQMNSRLMELDDAKAEFLNLISHEIRTPLNGIILPVELLKEPASPDETRKLMEILDISVKRLEKFSMNALLITRLKTRYDDLKKSDVKVENLITKALEEEQVALGAKNLFVKRNKGDFPGTISCNPDLIKKGIQNIIDNAISFAPPDSSIGIRTFSENGSPVIEITDNGSGIPESIILGGAGIFSRGKEYQDKSTGIGIPLTKMIMEAHGGELNIGNRKEGGAIVKLSFRGQN
jgi:two-component system, sensor histidine kinase and response regulator